ncbi:hydroxymethylpyrimidine/phosphomethylpyrimidine kinase [uncultured Polaribacter sp.]|uniref:hydroxymethylpyrimidine/phosphomethylpyrimidine kinase n=1 Tax=uncultured Polaribacter sp. TaxID=174711 RepID=UPI002625AEEA|nr:hydroxymethylpyrimidine/phosphomethylpyrimidine kinase [uncultured Polaribacter sp.]
MKQPKVLSIAGFDPSAGAGILADIKTFKHFNVYGFGILSAITAQNETEITEVKWISRMEIKKQVDILFKKHKISVAKIGIIQNLETLIWLIDLLRFYNPHIKVLWDPIIKSTSGFNFWKNNDTYSLNKVINCIDIVTPNQYEYISLWGKNHSLDTFPNSISVLYKSAIKNSRSVIDILWWKKQKFIFKQTRLNGLDKHGTGCILSAGIAANLTIGLELDEAYKKAKEHLIEYMQSSNSLLGIT